MNTVKTEYETIVTMRTVTPKGEGTLTEFATEIQVVDEGGGEFLKISQFKKDDNSIVIGPDEWPHIHAAIELMFAQIKIREGIK